MTLHTVCCVCYAPSIRTLNLANSCVWPVTSICKLRVKSSASSVYIHTVIYVVTPLLLRGLSNKYTFLLIKTPLFSWYQHILYLEVTLCCIYNYTHNGCVLCYGALLNMAWLVLY